LKKQDSVSTKDLNTIFSKYGEISSCKLEFDQAGKSKGYGYVSYVDPECADKAIESLNGKEINGKQVEITVLIPSKNKCCIYVKNFPRDFTEEDLKKFFSKFGEINSVAINRDPKGASKGFGFVTFASFQEANNAIKHANEEHFTFPGCAPLFASLPIKKEDRQYLYGRTDDPNRKPKIFARLIDVSGVVRIPFLIRFHFLILLEIDGIWLFKKIFQLP
jgi:polyadenylate-binding protein